MKRVVTAIGRLGLLAVIATPVLAVTAKPGSTAPNAGAARLVGDIVALAPGPGAPRPESVTCPDTMCLPVGSGAPEFDPAFPFEGPAVYFGGWTWQCLYVQGSWSRCLGSYGGLCTGTVSCNDISY